MIVLDNYWDKWWALVDGGKEAMKEVKSKYTEDGRGAYAKTNVGWNDKGRIEFGRFCKLVKDERESKDEEVKVKRRAFERGLMNHYAEMKGEKVAAKRTKRAEGPALPFDEYTHDLGSGSEGGGGDSDDEGETGGVGVAGPENGVGFEAIQDGTTAAMRAIRDYTGASVEVANGGVAVAGPDWTNVDIANRSWV